MLLVGVFMAAPGSAAADYGSNYSVGQAYGPLSFDTDYPGTITSSAPANWFYFDAPANSISTLTVTNTTTGTPCQVWAKLTDAGGGALDGLVLNDTMSFPSVSVPYGGSRQLEDATIPARRYYVDVFATGATPCSYSFRVSSSTPAPVDTGYGYGDWDFAGDGLASAATGPWPNGSTAIFATDAYFVPFSGWIGSARGMSFECDVDAGAWQPCQGLIEFSVPAEGLHVFSARGLSASGKPDHHPPQVPFIVDRTAPTASIDPTSATPPITGTASAHMTFITQVDVTLTSANGSSFVQTATWSFACGSNQPDDCIFGGTQNSSGGLSNEQWQVDVGGVPPGVYTATAQATDWAGNVGSASQPVVVTVA